MMTTTTIISRRILATVLVILCIVVMDVDAFIVQQQHALGGGVRQKPSCKLGATNNTNNNDINNDENKKSKSTSISNVDLLLAKAQQLKNDVTKLESEKQNQQQIAQEKQDKLRQEKEQYISNYSAIVPIFKPTDGSTVMEQVRFKPKITQMASKIVTVQVSLPLGVLLGQELTDTLIRVDEINPDSNASKVDIQVGDIVRACSECQMMMDTTPTWQLMAGGIGRPKVYRMMMDVDNKPLERVLEALASNRMDKEQRPVWLVLERAIIAE